MKKLLAALIITSSISCVSAGELAEIKPAQLWNQALSAYQRGNFPEAIKLLSARSRMAPADPNVMYYLGNCYLQTQKHDDAAKMFSACVRMSPASQAGQYSLQALEKLSSMPKAPLPDPNAKPPGTMDQAALDASKEALMSERALDRDHVTAAKRIKDERNTLKRKIDRVFEQLQETLLSMNRRSTPNYAAELAKLKSEAEIEVEQMQIKELRLESRLLAPDKIDCRAVPELPKKKDDSKNALGALSEYLKPEQPDDPLASEISPEITAKFMTVKDAFGDLSTYQPQARRLAKQMFLHMKSGVEMKQDSFDMQLHQAKERLIRDVYSIHANYGNQAIMKNMNPLQYLTSASIPRTDQSSMTPMDIELSQAAERTKKRLKELQDSYNRDLDSIIVGTKERLAGLVGTSITMGSQLKHPKGSVQLVPQGTTLHTRNYVNFGDHADPRAK